MADTTIYKYALNLTDVQAVEMPEGSRLLHVAMQHGTLTVWAHVDPSARLEKRLFAVIGTGNPAPDFDDGDYVGSVMDGPFVWHIFDGGATAASKGDG